MQVCKVGAHFARNGENVGGLRIEIVVSEMKCKKLKAASDESEVEWCGEY